jgi:hypothetical protein
VIRFLNPQFLFALSLISIPIIIHLFNLRRFKRVLFTNVKFLQELKEETTRLSKIKHLLVLASRILAITFLVLAFAQPIIPLANNSISKAEKVVSVYIDNSFSMDAISKEGSLLEVAKKKAREITLAFSPSTRFQILTDDFEAVHQRLLSRDEMLIEIDRVKSSPLSKQFSEVILRQQEALSQEQNKSKQYFYISDLQKTSIDFTNLKADSSQISIVGLPLQSTPNVYIDSCWFETPVLQINKPINLQVKLNNQGDKDLDNIPIRLLINGNQRAVSSLSLKAGESAISTMSFSVAQSGWQNTEVQISDLPITFDDKYFLAFEVKEKVNIINLEGNNNVGVFTDALFSRDSFFNFKPVDYTKVDYQELQTADIVLLSELPSFSSGLLDELNKFLNNGGNIVLFPDSGNDKSTYSTLLEGNTFTELNIGENKVEKIDLKHPLFSDVFDKSKRQDGNMDYPKVSKHFRLAGGASNRINLMTLEGGDPFLSEIKKARGSLYVFSVPLSPGFSNLSRHALVVPLLYRMALLSLNQMQFSFVLGEASQIELDKIQMSADETFHLKNERLKTDLIPSHKVFPGGVFVNTNDVVREADIYNLENSGKLIASIAFNYNRKESAMDFYTVDEIKSKADESGMLNLTTFKPENVDLTKTLSQLSDGISLWKYCIVFVLLFLLIEILLLRFWKTK